MTSEIIPYKDMEAMASEVVRSKLFPGIQSVSQALTLFLVAQAEGLHPMTAAMRYNVIQNRPALKADAMLASFMERGGTVKWTEWTNEACEAVFTSAGVPEGVKVRWTLEDANRAGVTANATWKKYPRQMLKARVASDGVRMADPAVNYGRYTPEEVGDFEPAKSEKAEFEVVGDEAGAVVRGASTEAPAPPAIKAFVNEQPLDEFLAEAKAKREAALADFGPKEPIEAQLEKAKAEIAKKHGRPKSIPDFCECGKPIQKFESSAGAGEYWECAHRNRERHLLKAQEADDATIRTATAGHFFKWAGK
jgi:hypothetical protein